MAKIFIVRGTTGEYSDQRSWLVAAYRDETLANIHADTAAAKARAHEKKTERYSHDDGLAEAMGAWDPDAKMDYAGTDYHVLPVTLRTKLPE
jgi:hypothetical protein